MSRVLVVDDEPAVCWSIKELLSDRGYAVETAASMESAWETLRKDPPDAIVLDVRLPGDDGLTALPRIRETCPKSPVIVITAFGDLPTAAKAFDRGAFEYLVKPFDLSAFANVVDRAVHVEPVAVEDWSIDRPREAMVGVGPAMQAVFRQIALVAPTEFPVLLLGETGTGKEVAARAIHDHSRRASGPFIATCLAALNPSVIESELFGHVRGAFTGAVDDRPGLFDLAAGGTLFLDEIAETPPAVQVKLLRVLETQKFCPVGSGVERTTDARVVAATHRNLNDLIAQGEFRSDFFHRLSVFTVRLPALRERREDLRPLVENFLAGLSRNVRPAGVDSSFWTEIAVRDWPGNVRELRNAIDHAVVLARRDVLRPEHLPYPETSGRMTCLAPSLVEAVVAWTREQLALGTSSELYDRFLAEAEPALLGEVLSATGQNRSAAARLLGLDRATLRTKLRGSDDDRGASS